MKRFIKIGIVAISFILIIFFLYLITPKSCLMVVTYAENIFTGECKIYSNSCIGLFYKRSERCRPDFKNILEDICKDTCKEVGRKTTDTTYTNTADCVADGGKIARTKYTDHNGVFCCCK